MLENIVKFADGKVVSGQDITLLFPDWKGKDERVVAVGPHDDDPLIGAGLLINELRDMGIDVYVAILTDGSKGYCKAEQKEDIVAIRKRETETAYAFIGIGQDRIKRFELPDSDLIQHAYKWDTEKGKDTGLIPQLIKLFRQVGATRFLLPNENDFHLDHQAAFHAALYAAIQASEAIVPDLGPPCRRDTILRYGVWSPFRGDPTHGIESSSSSLNRKLNGVRSYVSQEQIEVIKSELAKRGPFEYFQEHAVRMFPSQDYTRILFGGGQK
jgi:LmbE family N-acetylglucosaminyl deacetylase